MTGESITSISGGDGLGCLVPSTPYRFARVPHRVPLLMGSPPAASSGLLGRAPPSRSLSSLLTGSPSRTLLPPESREPIPGRVLAATRLGPLVDRESLLLRLDPAR